MTSGLLPALILCCLCGPPPEHRFLLIEFWLPAPVYGKESRIEVIQRITNTTSEPVTSALDFSWHSELPNDYYTVVKDGRLLDRKLAEVDWVITRKTTLLPGESVTVVFYLDALVFLPESNSRPGVYRMHVPQNRQDVGGSWLPLVAPRDLWFVILDQAPKRPLPFGFRKPVIKSDLPVVQHLLQAETTCPMDRLRMLEMVAETRDKKMLWEAISAIFVPTEITTPFPPNDWDVAWKCKDVYAVVNILRKLPKELLDRGYLFTISRTLDLTLRREALRALARCGPDKDLAARLSSFLTTQSDEIVIELGKQALAALEGTKRR